MLIKEPVPTPYTIVQHSFQLTFRKRKNGELLIAVYFTHLRGTHISLSYCAFLIV